MWERKSAQVLQSRHKQCKNYGMRISRDKTEVMVTSRVSIQCDIELDGETFKQVEQFKYLGSLLVREGGCKEDVKTRCLVKDCTGLLPTFTYTWAQRNQHDHPDTDHKGGIHPNSTVPEWKREPHQHRKADVDNNRDEVSQKSCRKDQNGQDQKRRN